MSSASRWKLRYLIAYRLLIRLEAAFLRILEIHYDEYPAPKNLTILGLRVLTGENLRDLYGFFWVTLARAARPNSPTRKQVEREDYISSISAIPGSSLPTWYSLSEFEVGANDIDKDKYEGRRSKPEEVTVYLYSAGLVANAEVRLRVERRTINVYIAGDVPVTAEDDGGICRVYRRGLGWEMYHLYLALLEVKRAFRYIHFDEKTGNYVPIYLGEAVITWKGNQELLRHR
ncbi:hypothetical protein QBC46DRAFT_368627 [Diplogelasinospora grovesii]|uniref:Uncharacterized protein n=1 Tax=Diplogelasinospora grovesii TaxID=303347 RepID=A0AAN6RYE3_9PEZI|nr:hypothetical protein QBC46DRAFT_368627 [Diplogelasinospora grovesii]